MLEKGVNLCLKLCTCLEIGTNAQGFLPWDPQNNSLVYKTVLDQGMHFLGVHFQGLQVRQITPSDSFQGHVSGIFEVLFLLCAK